MGRGIRETGILLTAILIISLGSFTVKASASVDAGPAIEEEEIQKSAEKPEQAEPEETAAGQEEPEETVAGQAESGETTSEQTESGETVPEQEKSKETVTEQAESEQDPEEQSEEWEEKAFDTYGSEDGLYRFLGRLYEKILQREGDQEGIVYWYELLREEKISGAQIVMKFGCSPEMKAQNLDNSQFVERLYETCFDRASDQEGAAYWTGLLDKGISRTYTLKGFAMSEEFRQICLSYGIQQGTVTLTDARDQNTGIAMYVYRCYAQCLNRLPDEEGMNYWCGLLLNGRKKPVDVARDFLNSPEMAARNLNDTEFVKTLYRTYFGREYDEDGLQYWTNLLATGKTRQELITSFSRSREFAIIVTSFGLKCDDFVGESVQVRQETREDGSTLLYYDTLQKNGSYTLYQVRAADLNGGCCYAIETPHGKLIMVDGGYKGDAVYVKNFIQEHGGVVDQWYITHPHFDHVGAFLEILDTYQDEVSIKEVYYNPFTEEFCRWAEENTSGAESKEVLVYDDFEKARTNYSNVTFKALVRDDQVSIDGIKIRCMNSFDSSVKDVNSNSLVLRIEISGAVFLITGDITDGSVQRMKSYYGENSSLWDVDVIQAPHHGYLAGISNTALYKLTGPAYAWMDCSQYEYENDSVNVLKHKKWIEDMGIQVLLRYKGTNEIHIN